MIEITRDIETILLFADIHLRGGSSLPHKARSIRETLRAGRDRGVGAVFIPGDVYDDASMAMGRDNTAGDMAEAIIPALVESGIPVFVLKGNHDDRGPGHRSALWTFTGIPNIEIVEEYRMLHLPGLHAALLPWANNHYLLAQPEFQGLSWDEFSSRAAGIRQQLLYGIAADWHGLPGFKLLLGHAEINGARNRYMELPPGSTHVFRIHDLTATGADQLAFGHYHAAQSIDGVPVYIGSLDQNNHGEEGNLTGCTFINIKTGAREFVPIDSPRHYTVTSEQYRTLEFRRGYDRVKVRDLEPPRNGVGTLELPEGVRFEKLVAPKEVRLRASDVTPDSTTEDLLAAWLRERPQALGKEELLPRLHQALDACPLPAASASTSGSVSAIREIRLQNVGPHRDTVLQVPETLDGLLALVGANGAGKTMALEAIVATLWGEFAFYPGPLYDLMPQGFVGDGQVSVVFESGGRTYRAQRRLHTTAKTRSQECYLHEIASDGETPIAGPKVDDYSAEVRRIAGDRELFLATVFQGQDDAGSLVDAEARDRMSLFRRWVGADRFEGLATWCKDQGTRLRGGLAERERRASELSDAEEHVAKVEATTTGQQQALTSAEAAVREAAHQVREAEEVLARLRADQLAREEIARQASAAEEAVAKARSDVDATRQRIGQDEIQLERESELRNAVALLESLRGELAEAQRQAERVAAEQARRDRVAAEIRDVDNQIASAVREANAAVQAKRNEKSAEIRSLEQQIGAAVREATAAAASKRSEIQTRGEALRARIATAEAEARADVREQRSGMQVQVQRAQQTIAAAKAELEAEQRRLSQRKGQLEAKARLLDTAGCKPALLACPFIDDARQSPEELAQVVARLQEIELALSFDDYAHEARGEAQAAQEALASLVDPDPSMIAPELRLELEALREEYKGFVDPKPSTVAVDLREKAASHTEALAALVDPEPSTVADDLRQQVAALRERHAAMAVPVVPGRAMVAVEADIRALGNPEQDLGRLAAVREQLEQRRVELVRLEVDLACAQDRLHVEKSRLDAVPSLDPRIADQQAAIGTLQQNVETKRQAVAAIERQLGSLEEQLRTARARVEERDRIVSELEAGRTEAQGCEILAEAFGATGIPQLLIDCALPQINSILADLASDMDEPVLIEMSTQRDLKGGGSREGLWIDVTDYAGTRDIKRHSCGEQGLYRKLFRQGLALFGVQRAGAHHQIYCVDEPTLGLDARNVPRLLSVIYKLAQRFRQVWVVSHDPTLLAGIPTRFEFERVNGTSRVRSGFEARREQPAIVTACTDTLVGGADMR